MTWSQSFQRASKQHYMQMTWWFGARKSMQLQPHTGCSWRLTSSTAGLRNGVLQSTRTNLPPPCSPCPQSKKPAPSLLVGPRWRRMKKQHTLASHLTRGRPGNSTLPRQKEKPDARWLSFANLRVPLGEQARKYLQQCTREQSDPTSSMAPQRGQPQQRPISRPLTRSRTRHSVWSLEQCDPLRSQKWRGSQESNLLVNGGTPRIWCRQKSSSAWQTIPWKPGWKVSPRIGWKEAVLSMRARSWAASFTTDCPRAHFPSSHQTCQSPGYRT